MLDLPYTKLHYRGRNSSRYLFVPSILHILRPRFKSRAHHLCSFMIFLNGPTPVSFCLFSFFSNTNFAEKLQTSVGFELGSSEFLLCTLTTLPPPRPSHKIFYSFNLYYSLSMELFIDWEFEPKNENKGNLAQTKRTELHFTYSPRWTT